MTRPLRIQYPGALYYVSQHSNSGSPLFKNDDDRKAYLDILTKSKTIYSINLHSFVLLKDHFHLLVETPLSNLSQFMRHLNITYTSYFNRIHSRKGHLFGGRFKSIVLEQDPYLALVSQYLHLNPIKKGAIQRQDKDTKVEHLAMWRWSSLAGFMGAYPRYSFIDHHMVLQPFGGDTPQGRQKYKESLHDFIDSGFSMKSAVVCQNILGSPAFIEQMKKYLGPEKTHREQPGYRKINTHILQEKVLAELEQGLHCKRAELIRTPNDFRSITMDMLYRFAGMTNPEIGSLMGLDYSSVSLGRKRIQQKRNNDAALSAKMTFLEKRLLRLLQ